MCNTIDDAAHLVRDLVSMHQIDALRQRFPSQRPVLVSAHAYEREGVNAIPEALAELLANILGWPVDSGLVQVNVVGHTGADGFGRLARQPSFSGWVQPDKNYLMVDDFVGMGGTLANLRGYIEASGGHVLGATVLTGKPRSAKLTLEDRTLQELRRKHGAALEDWWKGRFGHSFDALTESEAGYLLRTPDAESIRNRVIAAEQAGDRGKVR